MANIVRAKVSIQGTRPLLQHRFGPEAIPLEKGEKTGVAGNDPEEWRRSCMVTASGQLFVLPTYVFGCVRDGSRHTKKGRGSIQPLVTATLQIEDSIILLDRWMPKTGDPPVMDLTADVYIDVAGVRNPSTKARNVRYRLAVSKGWKCSFTLLWDRTLVSREQMRTVLNDASILAGLGDGRSVGFGRFEVTAWEEIGAEEKTAEGSVASPPENRVGKGKKAVRTLQDTVGADGVPR